MTPFSDVYSEFLNRVLDYSVLGIDCKVVENQMRSYLKGAESEFARFAVEDLSDVDNDLECYNADLGNDTINVLVCGMLYYWITPKVLMTDNFTNLINTKDYTTHSNANLLLQLKELRTTLHKEFISRISDYCTAHGDIESWRVPR